ncbi:MAG: hypothetical protein AAF604_02215 [Acidobacteriota bacterium]
MVDSSSRPRAGARKRRRGQLDSSALERLPLHPGLCANCQFLELQASKTSVFVRCGRSDDDERFPRYPRLPVHVCLGYEKRPQEPPSP